MPGLQTSFQELFVKWVGKQEMEPCFQGRNSGMGSSCLLSRAHYALRTSPRPPSSMHDQGFSNKNAPRDLLGTADTAGPGLASPGSSLRMLMLLVCGPNLESQEATMSASPWTELLKIQKLDFPGGSVVRSPPANAGGMGLVPGLGISYMSWSN